MDPLSSPSRRMDSFNILINSRLLLKHTYGAIDTGAESGLNSGLTMPAHEMSPRPGVTILKAGRSSACRLNPPRDL